MALVSSGMITIIDLSDPIISGQAPLNPVQDMLWLDTSITPNLLKIYRDGRWRTVNDITDLKGDLSNLKTEFDKISTTIDNINSELSTINSELEDLGSGDLLVTANDEIVIPFNENISTTTGISPTPPYMCSLKKTEGYFGGAVYIPHSNGLLRYTIPTITNTTDLTINLWCKPASDMPTTTQSNSNILFRLGSSTASAMITVKNHNATLANPFNSRLNLQFGNDYNSSLQAKDMIDPVLFSVNKWEMITVTFEALAKKFTLYRNGVENFNFTVTKVNDIYTLTFAQGGWYIDNFSIVKRLIKAKDVKAIFDSKKTFRDPNFNVIEATNPVPSKFEVVI